MKWLNLLSQLMSPHRLLAGFANFEAQAIYNTNGKMETKAMKLMLRTRRVLLLMLIVLLVGLLGLVGERLIVTHADPAPWNVGDVFAGVGNGMYKVYDNAGNIKETINDGLGGFTTGCAFNNSLDKLYTTNFSNTEVVVYDNADPHLILQTIDTSNGSARLNESITFANNGDFYVGHSGGNRSVERYNAAGVLQQTYFPAVGPVGTDWITLSSDQKTLFYTSEGGLIRRFDVSTNTQLADFANIGGVSFALRLLPPGDGTGGLLVAHETDIERLDGAGNVVKTYGAPGENSWFALNLDPNGTSFWSAGSSSGNFYRFNIATGAVEVGPINTGAAGSLFGLCVKGESALTPPSPPSPPSPACQIQVQVGPSNAQATGGQARGQANSTAGSNSSTQSSEGSIRSTHSNGAITDSASSATGGNAQDLTGPIGIAC